MRRRGVYRVMSLQLYGGDLNRDERKSSEVWDGSWNECDHIGWYADVISDSCLGDVAEDWKRTDWNKG